MATDLQDQISLALADAADDYDLEAIADAVAATGTRDLDAMPAQDFWEIVAQHALPDDTSEDIPFAVFQAEMATALGTDRPAGEPAVWRRGGVTIAVSGAPRRNVRQPNGTFHITSTAGHDTTVKAPRASSTRGSNCGRPSSLSWTSGCRP